MSWPTWNHFLPTYQGPGWNLRNGGTDAFLVTCSSIPNPLRLSLTPHWATCLVSYNILHDLSARPWKRLAFQGQVQSSLFGYFWVTLTVTVTASNRLLLVRLHSKISLNWLWLIKFMQNHLLIIKYIFDKLSIGQILQYKYYNKNYFL